MKAVAINGTVRTNLGTKFAKEARRNGQVPCVIYGGEQPIHFTAPVLAFRDLVYTAEARKVAVTLDGNTVEAVMKDIQFHPVTDAILHIDFIQLIDGKPVAADVPMVLTGTARGVRNGGKMKTFLRKVKVIAVPNLLPENLTHDITNLRIGQAVRVSDIATPEGVSILNAPSAVVVTIKTSRNAVAETEEEESTEEAASAE